MLLKSGSVQYDICQHYLIISSLEFQSQIYIRHGPPAGLSCI